MAVTRTDEPLSFAGGDYLAIQLSGDLVPADQVAVSVSAGTLSLSGTSGLTFSVGDGTDDSAMTFQAADSATANQALDGLSYQPPSGYAGRPVLSIEVSGTQTATALQPIAVHAWLDANAARSQILAGVSTIHSGVQPGRLIAYGLEAYSVARYPGDLSEGPLVAAASWGLGRVLAVPDHQMLNMGSYGTESGTFFRNGLAWLAGTTATGISVVTYDQEVADWLLAEGYTQVSVVSEAGLPAGLVGADVFVGAWMGSSEPTANLNALTEFAAAGGGLFIADYGVGYDWWWGKPIYEAPGNRLLREPGIGFRDQNRWDTGLIDASTPGVGQIHAGVLLSMLADSSPYTADELEEGAYLMEGLYVALPPGDPLLQQLDLYYQARIDLVHPTPSSPVTEAFDKALLRREMDLIRDLPPGEVTAHRTADEVYGAVPPGAPRVQRTVTVQSSLCRWQATGLYAAPGEVVTVTLPAAYTGEGFLVRISGHVDNISGRSSWSRVPYGVARSFAADSTSFQVASAFGGALYVDVGSEPPSARGIPDFDITIDGAVEAPLFVLGQTTDAAWIASLRDHPAPYAELVSRHLAISLPAAVIRDLDVPTALMTYWDQVVAAQDYVGALEPFRCGPERFNLDVQISVGYLHAGYPIQGPVSTAAGLVDLSNLLANGNWGYFHELGHEAQRRPDKAWGWDNAYTFPGDTEVTVNIFANASLETVAPGVGIGGWGYCAHQGETMVKALDTVQDAGAPAFDDKDPYPYYFQLADGFGFDTYRAVFQTYHDDFAADPGSLPSGEQEEKDQWLLRWSQVSGFNMIPYMVTYWGLEVSPAMLSQVGALGLPDWLPAVGTVEQASVQTGASVLLDLAGQALSYNGIATLGTLGTVSHGSLVNHGNGTVTYTPAPGFTGTDTFSYTLLSSTGAEMETEVRVDVTRLAVRADYWYQVGGTGIAVLRPLFLAPDETVSLPTMEIPVDRTNDYGARLRTLLTVPETGNYIFWIASDDDGELWLSENGQAAQAQRVAYVDGWTDHRVWTRYASQKSASIALTAGQTIYLEALMKEGGGGDHLSVAWTPPGGAREVLSSANAVLRLPAEVNPTTLYEDWARVMGIDGSVAGQTSNPDGDLLLNLQEYGFGSHPGLAGSGAQVLPEDVADTFVYHRRVDAAWRGLHYTLETATSLNPSDWAPVAGISESLTSLDASFEEVRISAPLTPGIDQEYLRVGITFTP